MAHEAFALSPISARAASPTDADFEAIRDAFVETARGRWFLDEYTRRNRNADTAMVLEAVERIERSLAAQKEEQQRLAVVSEAPPAETVSDQPLADPLPEAMAAVKAIVAAARESAAAALTGAAMDEMLAPSRKCARVIREIAWGLRESGADGRICTLLESQVGAINTACDEIAANGFRDSVLRIFDQAALDIEGITSPAIEAAPQAEAEPTATIHVVDFRRDTEDQPTEAAAFEAAAAPETSFVETVAEVAPAADDNPGAEVAEVASEVKAVPEFCVTDHLERVPDRPPAEAELETDGQPVADAAPEFIAPPPPSTLGESLIANGIIARPAPSRSDPLAAIRRMTQAEKIAFFS